MSNNNFKPGGQRRLIFTGNVKTNLFNKFTPGSGVGALSTSIRRNKYRRASTNNLTMAQLDADYKARKNGTPISYPKIPCCPSMTSNPSNLAFPYNINIPCSPISFTITNSDTWNVSYPNYPENNITITLSNGMFIDGPLISGTPTSPINPTYPTPIDSIYFVFNTNTNIRQYITSISDSNNTITWTTSDTTNSGQPYIPTAPAPSNTYDVIIWTRVC